VPAPTPKDAPVQLCAFFVGSEEYALDIRRVEEILQPLPVTPLPRAPSYLEGVVSLRGAVVPVVDVRKRLGAKVDPGGKAKLLICLVGRKRLGLLVDRVSQVVRTTVGELKPAPPLSREGQGPCVIGVCGPPEKMKLLLDVKALLQPEPPGGVRS
jgi:purine-binding chemotaxis protein CheW